MSKSADQPMEYIAGWASQWVNQHAWEWAINLPWMRRDIHKASFKSTFGMNVHSCPLEKALKFQLFYGYGSD